VAANRPLHWPTDAIRYDAHLWNAIGVAADVRRDTATAKTCYEEAVRRDPRLADAQFDLGTIFARQKDRVRAEACYEAAIAARADHDRARVNLAIHLADRGEIAPALQHLSMAEALNPLNAEAFANHAAILQRAGRNEEALEKLVRAAELDGRYRALCRSLQQALERQALQRLQPKNKPERP
jgi:tetratricopeptide (TPR) repeat protein